MNWFLLIKMDAAVRKFKKNIWGENRGRPFDPTSLGYGCILTFLC